MRMHDKQANTHTHTKTNKQTKLDKPHNGLTALFDDRRETRGRGGSIDRPTRA